MPYVSIPSPIPTANTERRNIGNRCQPCEIDAQISRGWFRNRMYFFTVTGGACSLITVNYFRTGQSQKYNLRRTRGFQVLFVAVVIYCIVSDDRAAFRLSQAELFWLGKGFSIGENKAKLPYNRRFPDFSSAYTVNVKIKDEWSYKGDEFLTTPNTQGEYELCRQQRRI